MTHYLIHKKIWIPSQLWMLKNLTLPETKIASENRPLEEEIPI